MQITITWLFNKQSPSYHALGFMSKVVQTRIIWIHSWSFLICLNYFSIQSYFLELLFSSFYHPWDGAGLVVKWENRGWWNAKKCPWMTFVVKVPTDTDVCLSLANISYLQGSIKTLSRCVVISTAEERKHLDALSYV